MRAALAGALAAALGCGAPGEAVVGGARLAEADGVIEAAEGPLLVVRAGEVGALPPGEGPVRVAIDRDVPWSTIDALLGQLRAAGRTPVVLVSGRRSRVRAIAVELPGRRDDAIRVVATSDGKACVSPPGVEEAKCVQRGDGLHIDRAFTRELVREAVKVYHLEAAIVLADDALTWADVVRAVDGARTCCEGVDMRVALDTNR